MRTTWRSRLTGPLSAAAVTVCVLSLLTGAAAPKPTKTSSDIARKVCQELEAKNFLQRKIGQGVGADLIPEMFKDLDSQKYYFLQSDIDQYSGIKDAAERVKAGDVSLGFEIVQLYQQRVAERLAEAHVLVDQPFDFTVDESIEADAKDSPWARSVEELRERWRKRVKYDLLLLKLDKNDDQEARKRLHRRYKTIADNTKTLEHDDVLELYLTALCTSFDPHSTYMSPRSLEDFQISLRLTLDGIGAALGSEDGYVIVREIVPGGAASQDGRLQVGDRITAVANGAGEFVDVIEMKLTKVVDMIRGPRNSKVRLQVLTKKTGETKVYELTRQKVALKQSEVKGEIISTAERLKIENGPKVGVINVPSFYRDFDAAERGDPDFRSVTTDVKKSLAEFTKAGGVDVLIIDLRWNGGGALAEAIDMTGLFIKSGPIVQVKTQAGKVRPLHDEDGDDEEEIVFKGPLIVVTNRLSASASEIFAGAIKDYRRGIVVGDTTTHGKGTVQTVLQVGRGALELLGARNQGAIKLTIQQFYRANGDSTQNLGVTSDIVLPSLVDNMELGEQFLDHAMPFDKVSAVQHDIYNRVTPELIDALKKRSASRVAENEDFQKTKRDIDKYLARKARKTIPLKEEDLRAERIEVEEKTKDKAEQADGSTTGPIFPKDAYNDELLNIAVDYLRALRDMNTASRRTQNRNR
jgi:carboxyl-terminal processing protease